MSAALVQNTDNCHRVLKIVGETFEIYSTISLTGAMDDDRIGLFVYSNKNIACRCSAIFYFIY